MKELYLGTTNSLVFSIGMQVLVLPLLHCYLHFALVGRCNTTVNFQPSNHFGPLSFQASSQYPPLSIAQRWTTVPPFSLREKKDAAPSPALDDSTNDHWRCFVIPHLGFVWEPCTDRQVC